VAFVALAPDSAPDRYARQEAALVVAGQPYLREVWRDATWRLYAVTDPVPLVGVPGRLDGSGRAAVRFTVDAPGDVPVRVRWSRWLTLTGPGGCLAPAPDGFLTVRGATPGSYRVTSSLRPSGQC
jgi:hypothetical protein